MLLTGCNYTASCKLQEYNQDTNQLQQPTTANKKSPPIREQLTYKSLTRSNLLTFYNEAASKNRTSTSNQPLASKLPNQLVTNDQATPINQLQVRKTSSQLQARKTSSQLQARKTSSQLQARKTPSQLQARKTPNNLLTTNLLFCYNCLATAKVMSTISIFPNLRMESTIATSSASAGYSNSTSAIVSAHHAVHQGRHHCQQFQRYDKKNDISDLISLRIKSSDLHSHRHDHDRALADAKEALSLAEANFDSGIHLVESHVQVGVAYLAGGNLKNAEKYLTQAHWIALKALDSIPAILEAKMHHALGRLYLAKEKLAEALAHFAEHVYFTSCAFGPLDPQCCSGYFHMGILFEGHDDQRCKSFRATVARIWRTFLYKVFRSSAQDNDGDVLSEKQETNFELNPVLEIECERHLQFLYSLHCSDEQAELDTLGADVCMATLLLFLVRGDASNLNAENMLVRVLKCKTPESVEVRQQAKLLRQQLKMAIGSD
eukprot:gene8472-946_t